MTEPSSKVILTWPRRHKPSSPAPAHQQAKALAIRSTVLKRALAVKPAQQVPIHPRVAVTLLGSGRELELVEHPLGTSAPGARAQGRDGANRTQASCLALGQPTGCCSRWTIRACGTGRTRCGLVSPWLGCQACDRVDARAGGGTAAATRRRATPQGREDQGQARTQSNTEQQRRAMGC